MSLMGERNEGANRVENCLPYTSGCMRAIRRDVFRNLGDILRRERVKGKAKGLTYFCPALSRSSSRRRSLSKKASPSMGFTLPLLRSS